MFFNSPFTPSKQHGDSGADFEMAEFFGCCVHEQVIVTWVRTAAEKGLRELLHGCFEFAVGSAELSRSMRAKQGWGPDIRALNWSSLM
jgi:hypothetical protein